MILIAANDTGEQANLSGLVQSFDYSAKAVSTVENALLNIALFQFRAVLVDVSLPDMDGVPCARKIREKFGEDAPPIIGLVDASDSTMQKEVSAAGVIDYLVKPVDREQLRKVLLRHLYDPSRINLKMLDSSAHQETS